MTKAEAVEKIKEAAKLDKEKGHIAADKVLCAVLREIGYGEVVDEYEKLNRQFWYS
jgi:hypothetical protein